MKNRLILFAVVKIEFSSFSINLSCIVYECNNFLRFLSIYYRHTYFGLDSDSDDAQTSDGKADIVRSEAKRQTGSCVTSTLTPLAVEKSTEPSADLQPQ